jgi:hypothetical protein
MPIYVGVPLVKKSTLYREPDSVVVTTMKTLDSGPDDLTIVIETFFNPHGKRKSNVNGSIVA